jgi:hypothetical protein
MLLLHFMKVEATFNCLQGITKISQKETDKIESFKGRKNKKRKEKYKVARRRSRKRRV